MPSHLTNQFRSTSEKWFHDLRSRDKFSCQWQNKIFECIGTKHFHLCAWENKWWISIYLPTYNALCKFLNRHESTWAEDRASLHQCRWSKPAPTCSQPTREVLGYESHHVPAPRLARERPGLALEIELERSKPLPYHTVQQKCTLHKPSAF